MKIKSSIKASGTDTYDSVESATSVERVSVFIRTCWDSWYSSRL